MTKAFFKNAIRDNLTLCHNKEQSVITYIILTNTPSDAVIIMIRASIL
jgi:hypothetical protein